ncbi:MAG: hypothetical protein RL338_220, partial [Chloroflexota bacterium]
MSRREGRRDRGQRLLTVALLLVVALIPAAAGTDASDENATRAEIVAFVDRAVAYAEANGKAAALKAFTTPEDQFRSGELYIFAYDFGGTVLGHGGDPALVGRNLLGTTDSNGVHVIAELSRIARGGSGWLSYTWPNPADGDRPGAKITYVRKVDETWFLGAGSYGSTAGTKSLIVALNGPPSARFGGLYAAQDQGYFARTGLSVVAQPFDGAENPVAALADGTADVAQASMAQAVALSTDAARYVNVAQLYAEPAGRLICRVGLAFVSQGDLYGRTIAVDAAREPVVRRILGALFPDGGRPTIVAPRPGIADLLDGRADCLWGYSFAELRAALDAGIEVFVVRPDELGVVTIGDGLYVDERRLADPTFRDDLVSLIVGLEEGWRYALENQTATVMLAQRRDPRLEDAAQRRQLEDVGELLTEPFGYLDVGRYETTDAWGAPRILPGFEDRLWTHGVWNEAQRRLGRGGALSPTIAHYVGLLRESAPYQAFLAFGIFAAAASGALLGRRLRYRIWGMTVLAVLTAHGGGVLRDVLLGGDRYPIYLVENPTELAIDVAAAVVVWLLANLRPGGVVVPADRFVRWADVLGFAIIGLNGALVGVISGASLVWVPIAAALSVAGGGILSEILVNREHARFEGEIYEEAAAAGALVLLAGLLVANANEHLPGLVIGSAGIALVVLLAVRYALARWELR